MATLSKPTLTAPTHRIRHRRQDTSNPNSTVMGLHTHQTNPAPPLLEAHQADPVVQAAQTATVASAPQSSAAQAVPCSATSSAAAHSAP